MSRGLSSGLQTLISQQAVRMCFLVELNLSSTLRVTDHYFDISYNSNTYTAGGDFVSVSTSEETGEMQVGEITLVMQNVTSAIRSLIQGGDYIDKKVNVYLGILNSDETFSDAISFFTGKIRSASIQENKDGSSISLIVANHWSNWNLTKGRHFTDESQQQAHTGDKGLEYADQSKTNVRWGA